HLGHPGVGIAEAGVRAAELAPRDLLDPVSAPGDPAFAPSAVQKRANAIFHCFHFSLPAFRRAKKIPRGSLTQSGNVNAKRSSPKRPADTPRFARLAGPRSHCPRR